MRSSCSFPSYFICGATRVRGSLFRFALGLFGPALVLLPLGFQYAWLFSIAGVAMFLAAFLLPPARPDTRVPDKARELGARAVVDGGSYQPGDDRPAAVRLFVRRESISALDASLRPLLVIPTAEIYSVRAFPNEGHWILRVEWADPAPASGGCSAEFPTAASLPSISLGSPCPLSKAFCAPRRPISSSKHRICKAAPRRAGAKPPAHRPRGRAARLRAISEEKFPTTGRIVAKWKRGARVGKQGCRRAGRIG